MIKELTIKEKAEYLKANGWVNLWTDHYWVQSGVEYHNIDWSGMPTLDAYESCREIVAGQMVTKIRKEKSLSRRQLADRIGVCESTVRSMENKGVRPNHPILKLVAKALSCSIDNIIEP